MLSTNSTRRGFFAPRQGSIGDHDFFDTARTQGRREAAPHVAGANDEHARTFE